MTKRLTIAGVLVCILALSGVASAQFHFTVTADPRTKVSLFDNVLVGINAKVGGPGVFHVSPGDVDPPAPLRAVIDARFGPSAIWYPGVGNHEAETAADMTWLRAEYNTGNGLRTPLKNATNQDGPPGSVETMYSWDEGNAHFIQLNEYWNGGTTVGSDAATSGDINDPVYNWLSADLAANTRPAVFVFGHEPAYPFNRHTTDSLNANVAHRDRFWALLEQHDVDAYICGHTHVYSKYQKTPDETWQIDVGNAGNGSPRTFMDVVVGSTEIRYDIYNDATGSFQLYDSWTAPVPEPMTMTLLALGGLAMLRRRRK